MKLRKTILLSALAVFACAFAAEIVFSASGSIKTAKLADKPDSILIETGGAKVLIQKDGDKWTVGDKKYPADTSAIADLVNEASTVKILETVSGGSDADRFGLDGANAVVVTLKAGDKELRRIEVGKAAATSRQSYVRMDGGKSVLLVSGNFKRTFGRTADDLRDKKIFALKTADITGVTLAGKTNYSLSKGGVPEAWTAAAPASSLKLDKAKVDSWVSGIATLTAESFAPEGTPLPSGSLGSATFKGAGKDAVLTVLAKEGEDKYLCSSSESPYLFYASASVVGRYLKPLADLAETAK